MAFWRRCALFFIEYDVDGEGQIELVALINAIEDDGQDPDGQAWLSWRRNEFDDDGLGCAAVAPEDLERMESAEGPDELRSVVEAIILADRAGKEDVRS
jgi:hypothetical protein